MHSLQNWLWKRVCVLSLMFCGGGLCERYGISVCGLFFFCLFCLFIYSLFHLRAVGYLITLFLSGCFHLWFSVQYQLVPTFRYLKNIQGNKHGQVFF